MSVPGVPSPVETGTPLPILTMVAGAGLAVFTAPDGERAFRGLLGAALGLGLGVNLDHLRGRR